MSSWAGQERRHDLSNGEVVRQVARSNKAITVAIGLVTATVAVSGSIVGVTWSLRGEFEDINSAIAVGAVRDETFAEFMTYTQQTRFTRDQGLDHERRITRLEGFVTRPVPPPELLARVGKLEELTQALRLELSRIANRGVQGP